MRKAGMRAAVVEHFIRQVQGQLLVSVGLAACVASEHLRQALRRVPGATAKQQQPQGYQY
ncbi:hypothetical protein D3C80_1986900 [compost metagenome]